MKAPQSSYRFGTALLVVLLWAGASRAEPWLAPGDLALRNDVQLLTDVGVLTGPASTWPLSWGDIAFGLSRADVSKLDAGARAAFTRLSEVAARETHTGGITPVLRGAIANDPRILRTFEETPRESEELEGGVAWTGLRMSYRLQATVVGNPDDDQTVRADGSYAGVAFGNWMLAASAVDRWWGPGWDGSLILSSNARPVPAVVVNRNVSSAPQTRWLRWVGPWSATALMGQLEHDRDVPDALLFGARVAFRPVPSLEIGLSRTAQWCGEGRPCDLSTFWNLLVGNDTVGVTTTRPEEPGNQLAGADLRWTGGPHGRHYAVYGQMIGEDISGGAPSKFTGLYGVEYWGRLERMNASYRVHLEGVDTAVNFLGPDKFNTAYEHTIYTDGYRYRGRAIGDSLDNDGRMLSFGAIFIVNHGRTWNALLQYANVNRDDSEKGPHSVSATAARISGIEVGHGRPLGPGTLKLSLGYERFAHTSLDESNDSVRVLVQWHTGR